MRIDHANSAAMRFGELVAEYRRMVQDAGGRTTLSDRDVLFAILADCAVWSAQHAIDPAVISEALTHC